MKYLPKALKPEIGRSGIIRQITLAILISMPLALQAALPDFTKIVDSAKDSVVNISTKTRAKKSDAPEYNIPELPEGSPFGELFEKFFDRDELDRRGREAQSLGSGFIISKDGMRSKSEFEIYCVNGSNTVIIQCDSIYVILYFRLSKLSVWIKLWS